MSKDIQIAYLEVLDKIADLEAKLAELNKEPLNCSQLEKGMSLCIIQKSEIAQLKQQLAEREKEIEELNDKLEWKSKWLKIADNMVGHYKKSKQDKISFVVERLEKVKEMIKNMSIGIGIEIYGNRIKPVEEYIDCQIEELKKGRD